MAYKLARCYTAWLWVAHDAVRIKLTHTTIQAETRLKPGCPAPSSGISLVYKL